MTLVSSSGAPPSGSLPPSPPVGGGPAGMVLRAAYNELLVREMTKGVSQKLPQRLWAAHYADIEPLQKALRHLAKRGIHGNASAGASSALVASLRGHLHATLQVAAAEYVQRVRRIVTGAAEAAGAQVAASDDDGVVAESPKVLAARVRVLHSYFLGLGDLHRYRTSLQQMECEDFSAGQAGYVPVGASAGAPTPMLTLEMVEAAWQQQLGAAEQYYWQALGLERGQAGKVWNQLAVCALLSSRQQSSSSQEQQHVKSATRNLSGQPKPVLVAVLRDAARLCMAAYRYWRAISAVAPFLRARTSCSCARSIAPCSPNCPPPRPCLGVLLPVSTSVGFDCTLPLQPRPRFPAPTSLPPAP